MDRVTWGVLSAVICPSQATATRLSSVRDVPQRKVHVIPYGITPPPGDPAEAERLRRVLAPNGELLVGMVVAPDPSGEHARHKGHSVLLEALARAARTDVRIVALGHDPGAEFAQRARELGVSDNFVVLPGFHDVAPYMAAFDVLAVPSTRDEALPLVIIEAMASGTPVLASRLAGIPETIVDGETGHTVPPGDVDALATKFGLYAARRTMVRTMGEGAKALYEREFSREGMTARTLAVYERALDARPTPGR
jgi:glycosyltransferase involved in cell wall biosynthesis